MNIGGGGSCFRREPATEVYQGVFALRLIANQYSAQISAASTRAVAGSRARALVYDRHANTLIRRIQIICFVRDDDTRKIKTQMPRAGELLAAGGRHPFAD